MNLKNIKNFIKESVIQNFMENVKHARRGASHQRPKSWSKGTKSGSDKKKMRREGKDAAREMNESLYDILKRKLNEQSPVVPSYEGDPELEADKIAGIESSLSAEERDPFHLLSPQDRQEVHDTLKNNPGEGGKYLLFRSGMKQLRTIADMAADTKTPRDDPNALRRIVQLADYMEKATTQHDDRQGDDYGSENISFGGPVREEYNISSTKDLVDIANKIPENRLQQQIYSMRNSNAFSDKSGVLPPHLVALNRIAGWSQTGMNTQNTPKVKDTGLASSVQYSSPDYAPKDLGLQSPEHKGGEIPNTQMNADRNEKATITAATNPASPDVQAAMRQALEAAARARRSQSPPG